MRTIPDYVASRRAKWRTDTESTIRFEATFYRNALLKEEKREIAKRERVPVELVAVDCLNELEVVELLLARIKAEIAGQMKVEAQLKMSTVRLRREKQLKIDLAVLREERKWLTAQREELLVLGYEKNTKFAELRAKIAAGEIEGVAAPVRTRRVAKKKARSRPATLAERTRVFNGADEVAAYIAAREKGEWAHDPEMTVDFGKCVYREGYFKAEREEVRRTNEGVPRWFLIYGRMTERQKWQLRIRRANAMVTSLKAQWEHGGRRKRIVTNLRALYAEIEWMRHRRDKFYEKGEWDTAFRIRWDERMKSAAKERARKAKARAERERRKYRTDEERKAAQKAISRRYRERKALAAGKPKPRHYRKYATDKERYQAILASNRESARRRKEREARGEVMPRFGVVDGFSFPHRPRRGPMIVECHYASFWGRAG